jgi:hypothetical protein
MIISQRLQQDYGAGGCASHCRLRCLTERRRRFIDRARLLNLGQVVVARVLLLGFAAPGAKRHVFDWGINTLAFGKGEFRPGFQRHARKQTRAVALLAQRNNHHHLIAVQRLHGRGSGRQHVEDGTTRLIFARQADVAGEDSNTPLLADRARRQLRWRDQDEPRRPVGQ